MRRPMLLCALLVLVAILATLNFWDTGAGAQDASPVSGATTLVLVEHNDAMTDVLQDDAGASVGDLRVWGPNALYDEANSTDSGATTQGTCVALNAEFDCLAHETIVFADGSTLEIQGVQLGGALPSTRTIIGGSGEYLGAAGTVSVAPTEDLALWTKTIEIVDLAG